MIRRCQNTRCLNPIPPRRRKYCSDRCACLVGFRAWYHRQHPDAPVRVPVVPREEGDVSPEEIERRYQAAIAAIRGPRRRISV